MHLSDEDATMVKKWLMCVAPQFSVCDCVNAAVTILLLVDVWHMSSAHIVPQPTLIAVPIHVVPYLVTCVPLVANRGPQIVMCLGTH